MVHGARAHSNRGANGIDGTIVDRARPGLDRCARQSCGWVTSRSSTTRTRRSAITERGADLRIVVADNRGGGIFSFLPQASQLPADRFEQLFGTPHDTDIEALAAAHRVPAVTVERADELVEAIGRPGPSVTRVVTDRAENVRVHNELNAAVAASLG